ncbi:MAG: DEAD/DEAH box helicase family protein, partial [Deltaproteobacteria bacterium]|nr:DEAD/DEAH box helicase family protein [Deltaproteobacteria bacterium]
MAGRKKTKAGETPLLDHAASAPTPGATSTEAAAAKPVAARAPKAAKAADKATAKAGGAKTAKAPKGLPSFSQQTVLFHWLLGQLDVPSLPASASAEKRWDALKEALEAVEAEAWITAPTPMGQALVTVLGLELGAGAGKKVGADDVLRWDARVFAITDRLNHAGRPEPIQWKYFQYLALVFTELYLERYFTDAEALRADLDAFLAGFTPGGVNLGLSPYRVDPETEIDDLAKLAFWMATGSGKTWLLHANLLQFLAALERHGRKKPERILLVSPNAGLSAQHKAELDLANIPARLFRKGEGSNRGDVVQIIEITKFSKKPGPDTIAVESLGDGENLVFVDEGHRGSSSVDGEWRAIRQALARQGFCFEYSATFAQAAAKNEEIRREYAKSILVDYAYRKFYGDGYGKHFRIMNIRGSASVKARELEGHHRRAYLTGALVVLAQQLMTWDDDQPLAAKHGLDRPFCVFVGASVTGGEGDAAKSDVVLVLELIARLVRERDATEVILDDLLHGRSGFATRRGQDVFDVTSVLPELNRRGHDKASLYEDMLKRVFNAGPQGGLLHLQQLSDGEGEIGLYVGDPTRTAPFGVINVGEPAKLLKLVEQTLDPRLVHVEEKAFKGSLFATINAPGSTLTMLIGAKKFTEGWSSWRVSLMGLLNIGRSAGTQIVQLFGRGVRLRGQNRSLKRATQASDKLAVAGTPASKLRVLETLNIFGVRADYMELFEEELRQDGIEEEPEPHLEVLPVLRLDPMPHLRVLRLPDEREWKRLERPAFAPGSMGSGVGRVVIDAYARVDIKGRATAGVQAAAANVERGPLSCFVFVDHDRLYRDLIEHKTRQGWSNLGLPREVDWGGARVPLTRALLSGGWYELKIPKREVEPGRLENLGLWQQLASELLLKYLARFRSTMLGRYQAARAEIVWLSELAEDKREALFPSQYTITVAPDQALAET